MIISKERIKREYELARLECPDQPVKVVAEKLGIPMATVRKTIQEQEQPA